MAAEPDSELESLGYKQELLRDMGAFQNFALSFSIISILTGAVTLYGAGPHRGRAARDAAGLAPGGDLHGGGGRVAG